MSELRGPPSETEQAVSQTGSINPRESELVDVGPFEEETSVDWKKPVNTVVESGTSAIYLEDNSEDCNNEAKDDEG